MLLDLLGHMFKQSLDNLGLLGNLTLKNFLLFFEFLHEVVDLLFFLVEDLILLHVIAILLFVHVALDLLDTPLV